MTWFNKLLLSLTLLTAPVGAVSSLPITSSIQVNTALDLTQMGLSSKQWILYNLEQDVVLSTQEADTKIKPASMTKLMTVILGIESTDNLDKNVTIQDSALQGLLAADASVAGFIAGETLTLRDILYGAMLPSGADATQTIALEVSGTIAGFVELMNQKANELGMSNTHFMNTHGLEDENHYSTVNDILKLLKYCYSNETFKTIAKASEYTTTKTEQTPEGHFLQSTLLRYITTDPKNQFLFYDPYIQGGKTGYTEEAGLCLASYASYDGNTYFFVSAGAPRSENRNFTHIEDANLVYTTLYEQYHFVNVLEKNTVYGTTLISKASSDFELSYESGLTLLRPIEENVSDYTYTYTPASESFTAPLSPTELGTLTITNAAGEVIYQETVASTETIQKSWLWSAFDIAIIILIAVVGIAAVVIICLVMIRQYNISKARKNRRMYRK